MSVVKTIYGNLPEDLNRLSISSLGYASVYAQQVHNEVDKISGRLQAALDAGEISGIDVNDFDDLTVKDASMLIEAIGRMPSTPLLSLRSISSASEDGLAGAVKQMGTLHDVFDKKGKGWLRMHTSIPEDDRQTNFQDHLQAIITQFTDVPSYDTVGETNLAQLAHRQGIQRMYSEALLHSCLRSSLPSFIKSVETQLKSRLKVKQGKTAKGFAGKALQKLEALSNVIDDIVNQTFVPASNVGESCKASLTQLPIQVEGDDLFHKLISVDGKTYTDRATNCTLSDAKVYGDALKRYARDRHDKVVEEQDPILKTIIPLWKDGCSTYGELFSDKGMSKLSTHANAYRSTWEPTLDGAKGHVLMEEARQQALFRKDAITAFKALSKIDLSLYSTTADKLGIQMESIVDAWTRFKNEVDITSRESYQLMDVTMAVFDRSEKAEGVEWLEALRGSGEMDAEWFEEYVKVAHGALEAYKEDIITLEELDTKLELPEAPVRPDVSRLDPEYSFNSHSEHRKTLPVEESFIEVNDGQTGGYTKSSTVDTVGEGTSQLTHRSKPSSRPAKTDTTGNRKKTKRGQFTADRLAAEHQEAREAEENKPTYAEMLRKSAPTATSETSGGDKSKGTDGDQSVVSST